MVKYELVSPVIGGTIKTSFDEETPLNAATKCWETLTVENKIFVNNLPRFPFSLMSGGNMYHFLVTETPQKKGRHINYTITDITDDVNSKNSKSETKQFIEDSRNKKKSLNNDLKTGGKRDRSKKDSSSSSSSDDDNINSYLKKIRIKSYDVPIYYWWYPSTYYKLDSIFTPVFVPTVTPYVELWMPTR
jgi:hypothetical protein